MLARESGVGVETIRFYERTGLLERPPEPIEGWREYGVGAVWTIRYVRLAQKLGFSLNEIKQLGRRLYGGGNFCRAFQTALRDKLQETENEIRRLTAMKAEQERALVNCLARRDRDTCPILSQFRTRRNGEEDVTGVLPADEKRRRKPRLDDNARTT